MIFVHYTQSVRILNSIIFILKLNDCRVNNYKIRNRVLSLRHAESLPNGVILFREQINLLQSNNIYIKFYNSKVEQCIINIKIDMNA